MGRRNPLGYKLDEQRRVVACNDPEQVNRSIGTRVARTDVGGFDVSTVFLSIDHNNRGDGPPILWETMVFGAEYETELLGRKMRTRPDLRMDRCSGAWEQAEEMHRRMVRELCEALDIDEAAVGEAVQEEE